MVSATDFFPSYMMEFMNLVTTTSPNFGSGMISRFSALWRRDMRDSDLVSRHPRASPEVVNLARHPRARPEDLFERSARIRNVAARRPECSILLQIPDRRCAPSG